jgi:hypothetical protein
VVVLVAKFSEGAWVTALLVPGLMALMMSVRRHYDQVAQETQSLAPLDTSNLQPPLVVVPIQAWGKLAQKALRFAMTVSPEIRAVHVASEEETNELQEGWNRLVEAPARQAGLPLPELVVLPSPYRLILTPIVDYVLEVERANPQRRVAVLIPELVEPHWYHHLLHNKRAEVLKALLLLRGNQRIVVINVPWYLTA